MKNRFCFLVPLLSCFFTILTQAQQVEKIFINPKNPTIQKQNSFIDTIKFTVFQSVEGISLNDYVSIRLTEKYFIVVDNAAGNLYLYTKAGTFVKKINYKSQAGDLTPEYHAKTNQIVFFGNNSNYTLTSKDRVKIQLDWNNQRNLKYFKKYVIDLNDTSFAIKKTKPEKYDLISATAFYANQYLQTQINTSPLYKDSIAHELNIYENEQLVKSYFPYNRVNEPKFLFAEESVNISVTDTPYIAYLSRPFCDTVYKFVKGNLSPVYQLVMPIENSLPSTFFTNGSVTKTERENFRRNNGWSFSQVRDFYETSRLIYISIDFFSHYEVFLYDKQTHTAYNANKIKADQQQFNLNLLSPNNVLRAGHHFYKLLKADYFISFFKQNPGIAIPRELSAILSANLDKHSSVLVEFKLKD